MPPARSAADLPQLEVLCLEGNCVQDAEQALWLAECSALRALTLEANPLAQLPGYQAQVRRGSGDAGVLRCWARDVGRNMLPLGCNDDEC